MGFRFEIFLLLCFGLMFSVMEGGFQLGFVGGKRGGERTAWCVN